MTTQLDLLLVHVPKFQTYYPAINIYHSCNRMAIGLLALADLVDRNGYKTRILHGGVEHALNKNFSFADYLLKHKPKYIGFSQHFHHNLVDTLQWASIAKKTLPDSFVFLGGFTSTFFADDIMAKAPFVDALCKGDAEEPLLKLLARNKEKHDLAEIPNLVWRDENGAIQENEQSYTITQEIINDLNFTNFSLFDHAEVYIDMPKAPIQSNLPGKINRKLNLLIGRDKGCLYWGLPIGRGCVYNCCYCGGGSKAQLHLNKRKGILFRDHETVIDSIKDLLQFGFKGAYVSFDPQPSWSEEYYIKLFQMMREEKLKFSLLFSSWRLPTNKFIDEFAKTFGNDSAILISPETGSDELRQLSRPNGYNNEELMATLLHADKLGVRTKIYFSIGAMEKSLDDFNATLALRDKIREQISHSTIEGFLVEIEPGAPWHLNPEKYDINLTRQNFDDFMHDHCSSHYSSMTDLGYTTKMFGDEQLSEQEFNRKMLQLKCDNFCDMRTKCKIMRGVWSVSRLLGLVPTPRRQQIDGMKP